MKVCWVYACFYLKSLLCGTTLMNVKYENMADLAAAADKRVPLWQASAGLEAVTC